MAGVNWVSRVSSTRTAALPPRGDVTLTVTSDDVMSDVIGCWLLVSVRTTWWEHCTALLTFDQARATIGVGIKGGGEERREGSMGEGNDCLP